MTIFYLILQPMIMQRRLLHNIWYSFPVQLFILHFRKYQVLLLIWYLLASTINSGFMKSFGADALFFVPEYLGSVSPLATFFLGIAVGVFIMSWNITTFILHAKRFKFLAATSKPFLKYCFNNAVLPLLFLLFYLVRSMQFNLEKELMTVGEYSLLAGGFIAGLLLLLAFSFGFFFGADRTILRAIAPVVANRHHFRSQYDPRHKRQPDGFGMRVSYYIGLRFRAHKARSVSHYSEQFLDSIFKRHHFSAILSIILAFIFLIMGGFFLDTPFFQVPAAVSITIFFAIMVAALGAFTYFLQGWSVVFVAVLLFGLNLLFHYEIIDPRNKAYGINYNNKEERPQYNRATLQELCTPEKAAADKAGMIRILNNWKQRQQEAKPLMVLINVSGGGLRSATFAMNTLQQLDTATGGRLMRQTFLISGSSGGMLAATYFRELYRRKQAGAPIRLQDPAYISNITQDLLNPVFSSLISRDLFSPAQKFEVGPYRYIKDRGYAFEEQLNRNTGNLLGLQLRDYAADEQAARIPLMIFNSVITRDGRKMMTSTQGLRFMMKPATFAHDSTYSPDAVDFTAFFSRQDAQSLRILTALRMNATFPYVLPNVWLPSNPVIDVMDAGIRDNFGQETSLRFIEHFRDWIRENTSGVVVLQLRDRMNDHWDQEPERGAITDPLLKPATMLQQNWYKLQDYYQTDLYSYAKSDTSLPMHRLTFMYVPEIESRTAALNFHLTAAEKKDIIASWGRKHNQETLQALLGLMRQN